MPRIPIIDHEAAELPVFEPGNLLDGARRQKGLPERRVPTGCLLDMDGELLDRLVASERAALDPTWPCFHTSKGGHDGQEEALDVCARAIASAVAHARRAGAGRDGDRP